MVDILGYRRKLGLIVPSVNTVALPDAFQMSLTGVTVHVSDILESDRQCNPPQGFGESPPIAPEALDNAMKRMASRGTHITGLFLDDDFFRVDGLGSLLEGHDTSNCVIPTTAMRAAIERTRLFQRVALLTPYSSLDADVAAARIESLGCRVIRRASMDIRSQGACAQTTFITLRAGIERILGDDIDGIIQLGHNLPLGRLVNNLEEDFGKPILAINHVFMWYMLRRLGIEDVVPGLGQLFLDF